MNTVIVDPEGMAVLLRIAAFYEQNRRWPIAWYLRDLPQVDFELEELRLKRLVIAPKNQPIELTSMGWSAVRYERAEAIKAAARRHEPAAHDAEKVAALHDHWLARQGGWAPKIGGNLSPLENQRTVAFLKSSPLPAA